MATPEQLTRAHGDAVAEIIARVLGFASRLFAGLDSWRDADAEAFVARVVPIVLAGERQIAQVTDSYLAQVASEILGTRIAPVGLDVDDVTGAALRQGTPPETVYARPFTQIWTELSQGVPLDAAVAHGEQRLEQLVRTDMQLAKTHSARAAMSANDNIVGYRRVLRGARSCAMCMIASTQRYRRERLMPIHPSCDCGVAPIIGDHDPGQVIDDEFLGQIHDAVEDATGQADAGARAPDYRKLIFEADHGEYGPTLTLVDHKFTGSDDISDQLG